jgi:hypothetical protein
MFKGLHCQSAISRGFDDKRGFQKVQNQMKEGRAAEAGGPFVGIDSSARRARCGWLKPAANDLL